MDSDLSELELKTDCGTNQTTGECMKSSPEDRILDGRGDHNE